MKYAINKQKYLKIVFLYAFVCTLLIVYGVDKLITNNTFTYLLRSVIPISVYLIVSFPSLIYFPLQKIVLDDSTLTIDYYVNMLTRYRKVVINISEIRKIDLAYINTLLLSADKNYYISNLFISYPELWQRIVDTVRKCNPDVFITPPLEEKLKKIKGRV